MGAAFHEVKAEEPQSGRPYHRWFQNDYFDVFLWYDGDGMLSRCQLCYDRYGDEHVFTWDRETNCLVHNAVNDGEPFYGHGNAAILEAAKRLPPDNLTDRFRAESESLPEKVREPVLAVIAAHR